MATSRTRILSGNHACAEGALAAGVRFFGGYPITPSSEIAEELSRAIPQHGGVFIQMEDEIASIGSVIGASIAGSKAMTATSGPGFSLMQENIGYACMAEIPCVIVNVMRGGPSTGLPTMPSQGDVMQARWGTHGDHPIIALAPFSVRETFDLTIRAFNLTETFRTPVILLLDEIIGHVNEKLTFPDPEEIKVVDRKSGRKMNGQDYLPYRVTESGVPPMISFGEGARYHITGLAHDETGFPTNDPEKIDKLLRRLNSKLDNHRDKIVEVEYFNMDDAEIGLVAYGSTARSARYAVRSAREKGIAAGLIRPRTLWPFADREINAYADQVNAWIVPEMNLGQIATQVECASRFSRPVHRINRVDGDPINPIDILKKIEELV
jgi:2-oxoglutarate/2-oxoacid ferredoxin oxidoreductase subunit alpha